MRFISTKTVFVAAACLAAMGPYSTAEAVAQNEQRDMPSLPLLDTLRTANSGGEVLKTVGLKRESDIEVQGHKIPTEMLDTFVDGLLQQRDTGADLSLDGKPAPEFIIDTLKSMAAGKLQQRDTGADLSLDGKPAPEFIIDTIKDMAAGKLQQRETGTDLKLGGKPAPEFLVETISKMASGKDPVSSLSSRSPQVPGLPPVAQTATGAALPLVMGPIKGYLDVAKIGTGLAGGALKNAESIAKNNKDLGMASSKRDSLSLDNPSATDVGSVKELAEGASKGLLPLAMTPVNGPIGTLTTGMNTASSVANFAQVPAMLQKVGVPAAINKAAAAAPLHPKRGLLSSFSHGVAPLPHANPAAGVVPATVPGGNRINGVFGPLGGASLPGLDGLDMNLRRDGSEADAVLAVSDFVKDTALHGKDVINGGSTEFVKNIYQNQARDTIIPPLSLFPGAGPKAKEAVEEMVEFTGIPVPGMPTKRMEKVKRKAQA